MRRANSKRVAARRAFDEESSSVARLLALLRGLFAGWRKYLNRQSERPLFVRVQRADTNHLARYLLAAVAEYRQHYRILPGLAGGWMLNGALHPKRRETGRRSPRPV